MFLAVPAQPPARAAEPASSPALSPGVAAGLSVRDFGARGDGVADDTPAFAAAVATCLKADRALILPAGDYRLTDTLRCHSWSKERGRGSLTIRGESVRGTRIHFAPKSANAVLFEHAEWFVVKDLSVLHATPDAAPSGIVFATPMATQSAWSSYENIDVRGPFKYAWFNRFTMHDQWRNIRSKGPACHFMFALRDSHDDPLGKPVKGWNGGSTGWFHNLGTMDGVICDDGEVGVAGAVMQFNFVQLTTQGQETRGGAKNLVLPKGDPGTGLYLVGADSGAGGALRGNTIGAFYTEVTERPVYARNAGVIRASSVFFQGGGKAPYPAAIALDNTRLVVGAATVRMPFTHLVTGKNKAFCAIGLLDGGPRKASLDGGSRFVADADMPAGDRP